jgi:carboxylesterase
MKSEINILIHGFSGNTGDIAYLGDFLRKKGRDIHLVALAGHGGTKKQLATSTHADWIGSAKNEVAKFVDHYEKINLMGFSMGGLICATLAADFGAEKIGKIVFINSPIYFWNGKIIVKDITSRDKEKIAYYKNSAKSTGPKPAVEFLRMLSHAKGLLADTMPPSLILQCMDDESVRHKSAAYLKEKLGARATVKYYQGGCHQIFVRESDLREALCADIYDFIG